MSDKDRTIIPDLQDELIEAALIALVSMTASSFPAWADDNAGKKPGTLPLNSGTSTSTNKSPLQVHPCTVEISRPIPCIPRIPVQTIAEPKPHPVSDPNGKTQIKAGQTAQQKQETCDDPGTIVLRSKKQDKNSKALFTSPYPNPCTVILVKDKTVGAPRPLPPHPGPVACIPYHGPRPEATLQPVSNSSQGAGKQASPQKQNSDDDLPSTIKPGKKEKKSY